MRVADWAKWMRAKRIATALLALLVIACAGGLEGTEPLQNAEWLLLLMPALGYMVHNITKHYK
jgi:hypothetical protein